MNYELKPNLLYRLAGEKTTHVVREPSVAYLIHSDGSKEEILPNSLASNSGIGRSLIGTKLTLSTQDGKRVMRGLPEKPVSDAYSDLSDLICERFCEEVQTVAVHLRKFVSTMDEKYIRTSEFQKSKVLAQEIVNKYSELSMDTFVNQGVWEEYVFIEEIAYLDEIEIENLRANHIENHKIKFNDYFDSVEKNPLTESQRIACITDNDYNLVIAGAGTGKTSTMIGRAGYLIKSGLAQPSEILLLAYGKQAAEELDERIEERLGSNDVQVNTFHSLGLKIVAEVERAKPSVSPLVGNSGGGGNQLLKFVREKFAAHCQKAGYRSIVLQYFFELNFSFPDESQFKNIGQYYQYLKDNGVETFNREAVKSHGEYLIANYLARHGIKYKYEEKYEYDTRTPEYSQYKPDFFLTDYGIYIEYFGVDRNGNTAPYIDKDKYNEGIKWKRQTHNDYDTHLVESFYYEIKEKSLLSNLKVKLENHGVVLQQKSQRELLKLLEKPVFNGQSMIDEFTILLKDLLLRIRGKGLSIDQLEKNEYSATNKVQMHAVLKIIAPILNDYLGELASNNDVDFDDMIQKSCEYVTNDRYTPKWKFVLIDEFQDISRPRAELIKAISSKCDDCSVFAVGDDWQSIYRFTGSDISITTNFNQFFGSSKINILDTTFRFNDKISKVASSFIQQNPYQIRKKLQTIHTSKSSTVAVLLQPHPPGKEDYDPILSHINKLSSNPSTVFILSRFSFYLPNRSTLNMFSKQYKHLSFKSMTIHSSKGKEADYVIIAGVVSGQYGLPSMKATHPLLEELLPKSEIHPHAEERRLFYVALTRCKKRAYIISNPSTTSEFVNEIIIDEYDIDRKTFPVDSTELLIYSTHCPSCTAGKLMPRKAGDKVFYGCSLFPRCKYSTSACEYCNFPLTGHGYKKRCINEKCSSNE